MKNRTSTVRQHEAWITAGRPTCRTRIDSLLDELDFEDCDKAPRPQEPIQTEAADERNVER